MAVYASDEQLYSCFKALFDKIEQEDAAAGESLLKSKLSIRFQCSDPTAAITIDARKKPVNIAYGSSNVKPILDISLSADTLHEILLGKMFAHVCRQNHFDHETSNGSDLLTGKRGKNVNRRVWICSHDDFECRSTVHVF